MQSTDQHGAPLVRPLARPTNVDVGAGGQGALHVGQVNGSSFNKVEE